MGKCCVCGGEADFLAHGIWWCEKHKSMLEGKSGKIQKAAPNSAETGQSSIDLNLNWV